MGLLSPQLSSRRTALFIERLRTAYQGGISLIRCFELIAEPASKGHRREREIARGTADALKAGATLHDALYPYRNSLGMPVVEGLSAANESGRLPDVLAMLVRHFEGRMDTKRKLIMALTYPICLIVIIQFIKPFWKGLFLTKLDFIDYLLLDLRRHPPFLITVFVILPVLFRLGAMRHLLSPILIYLWPISTVLRGTAYGRFLGAASVFIDAGLNPAQALSSAAPFTNNWLIERRIEKVLSLFDEGTPVNEALAQIKGLPRQALPMATTGELTGKLPETLAHAGRYLEDQSLHTTRIFAATLETWLILMIGIGIGL